MKVLVRISGALPPKTYSIFSTVQHNIIKVRQHRDYSWGTGGGGMSGAGRLAYLC